MSRTRPSALVVGSGLAGLTCARELASDGWDVLVVSAGHAARDGATHRVHAFAPWVLLSAPWVRGDTPARFAEDLRRRGQGCERPGLAEVLAEHAHPAARALMGELGLEPMDGRPVSLPGDEFPRGMRCLPRHRHSILAPALARCSAAGVRFLERTVALGLAVGEGRVAGAVLLGRDDGAATVVGADAVVLACGGSGAVFPVSTSPRWCRGSGLALAAAAGALLHRPGLTQALPVTSAVPMFFPGSAALVRGRIEIGDRALGPDRDLEATALAIASAVRAGTPAILQPTPETAATFPAGVRASAAFRESGRVALTIAQHHGIGGVAIDAWGRTSLPGLYACGEAAGGVQGRRRTMGTGLLEAAIFGSRAAQAASGDRRRAGRPAQGALRPALPALPLDVHRLESRLDELMGPLVLVRPDEDVEAASRELAAWPLLGSELSQADGKIALAAIRLRAALTMLAGFREDPDCRER